MISLLDAVGMKPRQDSAYSSHGSVTLNQILRKMFTLRLESKWEYISFKKMDFLKMEQTLKNY